MSQSFTLTGLDAAGNSYSLGAPLSLTLTRSVDSPADGLEVSLPCPQNLPILCRVQAFLSSGISFAGEVDEEERSFSPSGCLLSLSARSDGALLLDNEALPQRFDSPRLMDIYQRYIAPYGRFPLQGFPNPWLPSYRVGKGSNEWEAFAGFCESTLGTRPYLSPEGVLLPKRPSQGNFYSLGEDPFPCQSLTILRQRSRILSKICIRGEEGYYTSAVTSDQAAALGVRRKQYWIPPDEYQSQPQYGADQLLKQAWQRHWEACALVAGLHPFSLGDRFSIPGETGLYPREIRWEISQKGQFTRLYLRKE